METLASLALLVDTTGVEAGVTVLDGKLLPAIQRAEAAAIKLTAATKGISTEANTSTTAANTLTAAQTKLAEAGSKATKGLTDQKDASSALRAAQEALGVSILAIERNTASYYTSSAKAAQDSFSEQVRVSKLAQEQQYELYKAGVKTFQDAEKAKLAASIRAAEEINDYRNIQQARDFELYKAGVKTFQDAEKEKIRIAEEASRAAQAATPAGVYQSAGIKDPVGQRAEIEKLTNAQALLRSEYAAGTLTSKEYHSTLDMMHSKMNILTDGNSRARSELRQLNSAVASLSFEFAGAAFGVTMLATALASPAIFGGKYLKELEDVKLGITGVILAMGSVNGQALTFGQASQVAEGQVRELANTSMFMAGTTLDLAKAFQAVASQGLEAGMTIDQIRTIAIAGVAAGRALGISVNTLQRDIRDMVLGIRPNSTILSASLGITKADIDAARANAGGLYEYLDGKLKGFIVASAEYNKTFTGMWEQMSEMVQRSFANSSGGIFDSVKQTMQQVMDMVGTIDAKTHVMTVNPEFKRILDQVMVVLEGILKITALVVKALWALKEPLIFIGEVKLGIAAWGILETTIGRITLGYAAMAAAATRAAEANAYAASSSFVGPAKTGAGMGAAAAVGVAQLTSVPVAIAGVASYESTSYAIEHIPQLQKLPELLADFALSITHAADVVPTKMQQIGESLKANSAELTKWKSALEAGYYTAQDGSKTFYTDAQKASIQYNITDLEKVGKELANTKNEMDKAANSSGAFKGEIESLDRGLKQLEDSIKAVGGALTKAYDKEGQFLALGTNITAMDARIKELRKTREGLNDTNSTPEARKTLDDLLGKENDRLTLAQADVKAINEQAALQHQVNVLSGRAGEIAKINLDIAKQQEDLTGRRMQAESTLINRQKGSDGSETANINIAAAQVEVNRLREEENALIIKKNKAISALSATPYEAEKAKLDKLIAGQEAEINAIKARTEAIRNGASAEESLQLAHKNGDEMEAHLRDLRGKNRLSEAEMIEVLNQAAQADNDAFTLSTVNAEKAKVFAFRTTTDEINKKTLAGMAETAAIITNGKGAKASSDDLTAAIVAQNKGLSDNEISLRHSALALQALQVADQDLQKMAVDAHINLLAAEARSVDVVEQSEDQKLAKVRDTAVQMAQTRLAAANAEFAGNALGPNGDAYAAALKMQEQASIASAKIISDANKAYDLDAATSREKAHLAAQKKIETALEKSFQDIAVKFVDGSKSAIQTAESLFTEFKTYLVKTIADAIYNAFIKQQIVVPISVAVTGVLGGTNGTAGSAGNVLSTGSNLYGAFSGSGSAYGMGSAATSFASSSAGQALGLSETVAGAAPGAVGITDAGSSLISGASAIGGAAPYLAAAAVVASLFSGKGGGPKTGGFASTQTNGADDFARDWTPNNADSQFAAALKTGSGIYSSIAAKYGATAAAKFSLGGDSDPQGSAPNRYSTNVTVGGQSYGDYQSDGRGDMGATVAKGMNDMILLALQHTDMGPIANALVKGIDPTTITTAEMAKVEATLTASADVFGKPLAGVASAALQAKTASAALQEEWAAAGGVGQASVASLKAQVSALDMTTEAGQKASKALLGVAPSIQAYQTQLLGMIGFTAQSLTGDLMKAIQNSPDAATAGATFASDIVGGVQNAMLGNLASDITNIVISGIVQPALNALLTGESISEVLSQKNLDAIIAQATATATTFAAIWNDPSFKAVLSGIKQSVASTVGAGLSTLPSDFYKAPAATAATTTATNTAATNAANLATQMEDVAYQMQALPMTAFSKSLLDISKATDKALDAATKLGAAEGDLAQIRALGAAQAHKAIDDAALTAAHGYLAATGDAKTNAALSTIAASKDAEKTNAALAASLGMTSVQLSNVIQQSGGWASAAVKYWGNLSDAQKEATINAVEARSALLTATQAQFDAQEKVVATMQGWLDAIKSFSDGLDASILTIRMSQQKDGGVGLLKAKEADISSQLYGYQTKGLLNSEDVQHEIALATQLKDTILQRYQIEAAGIQKAQAFSQSLGDWLDKLRIGALSPFGTQQKTIDAQAQYDGLVKVLRDPNSSSMAITAAQGKYSASAEALLTLDQQTSATSIEYAKKFATVQADALSLGADSRTEAQRQTALLSDINDNADATVRQLAGLKDTASAAYGYISGLMKPEVAVLATLANAVQGLDGTLQGLPNSIRDALSGAGVTVKPASQSSSGYASYSAEQITGYVSANNITSVAGLYAAAVANHADPYAVGAAYGFDHSATDAALANAGVTRVPGYAVGSNYIEHDGPAIVHRGEEITPRPFVDMQKSARDETNRLLSELVKSNREMKAELTQMKTAAQGTQRNTGKTSDLLVNVTRNGNSLITTAG